MLQSHKKLTEEVKQKTDEQNKQQTNQVCQIYRCSAVLEDPSLQSRLKYLSKYWTDCVVQAFMVPSG